MYVYLFPFLLSPSLSFSPYIFVSFSLVFSLPDAPTGIEKRPDFSQRISPRSTSGKERDVERHRRMRLDTDDVDDDAPRRERVTVRPCRGTG